MSIIDQAVLLWVICLCCKVIMTNCDVVLVNRNVADSFRVGKDGCTNDTSVCPNSATCHSDSGLCLCAQYQPNFRNPAAQISGKAYGCLSSSRIRFGFDRTVRYCEFNPFQLIPYSHEEPATQFISSGTILSCLLDSSAKAQAQAKFPNNTKEMDLHWLNESYVNFTVSNNKLYFKWRRSVPGLRGTIITLHLRCTTRSTFFLTGCLRAKVFGTWPPDAVPLTTEPTVTSTQPETSQNRLKIISLARVTTIITAKPTSTSNGSSDEEGQESNASNTALIVALAISLVIIVVLGIVVGLQWKKLQSLQDSNSGNEEMQNIDEERTANSGDEISVYNIVVTDNGTHNDGIRDKSSSEQNGRADEVSVYNVAVDSGIHNVGFYDERLPSSGHSNSNKRFSDHNYEEPSNYEPLRRNPLQEQNDDHNYQSLTTSQQEK